LGNAIYLNDLLAIDAHRISNATDATPDSAAAEESCHVRSALVSRKL
jgi:hypothetical protein